MTSRCIATLVSAFLCAAVEVAGQEVTPEYRAKAEYLVNFVKYVDWADNGKPTILICVAGQNVFGSVLDTLTRNEKAAGKPLSTTVILEPMPGCDVVFTPRTSAVTAYLRAAAGTTTLTVGETPRFLEQGGIIRFVTDANDNLLFEINRVTAERAKLRINSQLLKLARIVESVPEER